MSAAIRYCGKTMRRRILAGDEPTWLLRHTRRNYVRQAYLSCPEWADRGELRWIDWCRRAWTAATGIEHTVDHEVPLNHPKVCGLTVPWNLRLVTRAANAAKGGAWSDEHAEQLVLTYYEPPQDAGCWYGGAILDNPQEA